MMDISKTILTKSDQLNADDLIGRSLTILITKMSLVASDQPLIINYENDEGKPYKPGKSMRRVLANLWGIDGNVYVGRSLTLYRDEKVSFGGMAVGGIRISHASHIKETYVIILTSSRASKKPFTVKPLIIPPAVKIPTMEDLKASGMEAAKQGEEVLKKWWNSIGTANLNKIGTEYLDLLRLVVNGNPPITNEVPLLDLVNNMVMQLANDKELIGTEYHTDVLHSAGYDDLYAKVKASGNQELINKLEEAVA